MEKTNKVSFLINILFYGTIGIIIYFSVKFLFAYLLPFIIGTVITVMVQKPASKVADRIKVKKGYCALTFVILTYLIIIFLIVFSVFEISVYVYNIATGDNYLSIQISSLVDNVITSLNAISVNIPEFIQVQFSSFIRNVIDGIVGILSDFAKSFVKAMPMFITSSIVTIIASCYIAKDYDRFKASISSVVSNKYKQAFVIVRKILKENVSKVLIGYLKILLITFIELSFGLFLLRINNFLLYSALIALLDLLPIFGTGTVLVPWGIYCVLTDNLYLGVGLLILYSIITIVKNIIEPKIIGKQIGLHPLIALICVFIGLKLFGFIGIFVLPFSVMFAYKLFNEGVFELLFDDGKQQET